MAPPKNNMIKKREKLAEYAHNTWSGWMRYIFSKSYLNSNGSLVVPVWAVERWKRQMNTKYSDLTESEKASDREEALKIIEIIGDING